MSSGGGGGGGTPSIGPQGLSQSGAMYAPMMAQPITGQNPGLLPPSQGGPLSMLPSFAPFPAGLNQQVAPFSPYQLAGMQGVGGLTPYAQSLANQGAGINGMFASGAFTGPNPFLNQYYNQAAGQDVQNYMMATQPSLQAQAEQAGTLDSTGFDQQQAYSQYGLGQSLATLGANIYEPAYQQGMANQLNAAQYAPTAAMGVYGPQQQLYNTGAAQQQQFQNELNTGYQNAVAQTNWPWQLLQQLGGAMGLGTQGAGVSFTQGPAGGGGGMGK